MKKIISLFATKKVKIMIGLVAAAIVVGGVIGVTSTINAGFTGLLNFFGRLVGTATVSQAVLVDGYDYTQQNWDKIQSTVSGYGGETVVDGPHYLINRSSVPQKVQLITSYDPDNKCNNTVKETTYQLVTTLFGKRGPSAEWSSETAYSGNESVKMTISEEIPAGTYNKGALVQIPIEPIKLDELDYSSMAFKGKGGTVENQNPYYQLKIDLGSSDYGRFVVLTPTEPVIAGNAGDNWVTGSIKSDNWCCWSFVGPSIGCDPATTLSEWHNWLMENYPNYTVIAVNVQYGWKPTPAGTVYVDEVTFNGQTWDLESDELQSRDLGPNPYIVLPIDWERYDFTISTKFKPGAVGTCTIYTEVKPKQRNLN